MLGELGTAAAGADPFDEVPHDSEIDVSLEKGDSDLAENLDNLGVAQSTAAAKAREDCIETIGQGIEHELAQVSRATTRAPRTTNASASAEQRRDELGRIERHKVRQTLTDPDELDR
jgi:hypothetical protein